ncbi:MAG: DUF4282 domain-containing protein [Moraxellaceae bacterium]|nr:DUF4282 domain-containing protein [Moraxellaceae bacterium]
MTTPANATPSAFRHFLAGLLDLRFTRYLSMQLLPIFYGLLLLGAAVVIAAIVALAFWLEPLWGMACLLAAPLAWLVTAAVIRAALEFLVMAHRIMITVQRMDGIPDHVDALSIRVENITTGFEQVREQVDNIHTGFGAISAEVQHVRRQVDGITGTVSLLAPLLRPLKLVTGLRRRPSA